MVACEPADQLRRLMLRDSISEEDARQRISAQMSTAEKVRLANYVIRTDGTFAETNEQVRQVLAALS